MCGVKASNVLQLFCPFLTAEDFILYEPKEGGGKAVNPFPQIHTGTMLNIYTVQYALYKGVTSMLVATKTSLDHLYRIKNLHGTAELLPAGY